jgi:hypothetical protein
MSNEENAQKSKPALETYHRFLDEAGDTAFYGNGKNKTAETQRWRQIRLSNALRSVVNAIKRDLISKFRCWRKVCEIVHGEWVSPVL